MRAFYVAFAVLLASAIAAVVSMPRASRCGPGYVETDGRDSFTCTSRDARRVDFGF